MNTEQHTALYQAVCIRHHVIKQNVSNSKWVNKRLSANDAMLPDNRLY